MFQLPMLLPRASAIENVELPLVYAGVGAAERRRRARGARAAVGLDNRMDHQTQISFQEGSSSASRSLRAIVNDPAVILADEPTGALDSCTSDEILSILEQLHRAGHTIVVVTHAGDVAERARRRISILDGRIVNDQVAPIRLPRARVSRLEIRA